ncbi:hypothetical protein NXS19_013777 [Fusarium pseudograminearum]|nr:hypothetical protein NXS19_013777 [Fusarium pseudograminearum]
MTKPGTEFIESLHALFREAGLKGRDPEIEFIHLRSGLIRFISKRASPTRASCRPLRFTDGNKPNTHLVSPSPDFNVDEKRAQLDAANTASDFIDVLKGRNEHRSSRKESRKKTSGKKRSISPPESPKSKVQKRIEAVATSKAAISTKDSPKKRIKFTKGVAKDANSSPVPKAAQQTNNHTVPTTTANVESSNQADQEILSPKETNPSNGKLAEKNGTASTQQESDERGGDSSAMLTKPPHCEEDTPMEDASVASTDNHLPPSVDLTSSTLLLRPKMSMRINGMNSSPRFSASVRRLQSAIASIEQERSLIPSESWKKYEDKLFKKAKDGVFDADWGTRLAKISRIIWIEEEEAAMNSKDWDRLRAAARTWAILAEVAGPMMEEGDQQRSNEWLLEKLGDIDFMERLFACKERLAAIEKAE